MDVVVQRVHHDQHRAGQPERLELLRQQLGFRRVDRELIDDRKAIFANQLRQDRRDPGAEHLPVHLLGEVLVGRTRENLAAAAPQRTVGLSRAGASGAFLRPRLLVRLVDVGTAFLRAVTAARVGLVRRHELMDQRFVIFASEQRVRCGDRRRRLAAVVDELQIHVQPPFFSGVLTEGRTTMWPPSAPGTAPLTSRRPRATSTRTTLSVCTVRVSLPYWPAMRLPGNTRPGSCAMPIEPGLLCERELPCEARFELKLWRRITPEKPRPLVVPCTSTSCPTAKVSTLTVSPSLNVPSASTSTGNSLSNSPDSTPAFARCPAAALLTRLARRLP